MAILNLSLKEVTVPAISKSALVLPILKAGKPPGLGSSYHPISLISPVIKILQRLLLPTITASLKTSPTQHGFKSITTALLPLVNKISEGFNRKKPAD
jgi:hypothetical protein